MRNRISARELYDQLQERLGLRWLTAGQRGGERTLERGEQMSRRPSLAGYLNVIHPNKVQIVGSAELAWLDALDARQRWETLEKIMGFAADGAGDQPEPGLPHRPAQRRRGNRHRAVGVAASAASNC